MEKIVTRKRNGGWEYRFEDAKINGKRKQYSKSGFKTKKEALEAGTSALNKYNKSGESIQPSEISFSDYLDIWMNSYCRNELKPATLTNYKKKIKLHLKSALGMYKLKALNAAILQGFITDKFNEGYSRNTLSVIKGMLSNSLGYAVEPLRYIDNNPMIYVKMPSTRITPKVETRTAPHTFITPEQMNAIFERFPEGTSEHIPLMLGYKCGLRLGETFALRWSDIDLEEQKLTVNRQVQWHEKSEGLPGYWFFTKPKYDSVRTIDLDSELTSLLRREKERQERAQEFYAEQHISCYETSTHALTTKPCGDPLDLVCVRESGEFIQPRIIQNVCRVVHLKMNFPEFDYHSLRHTHCTMLLEAGAAPKYVQHRLGHKNLQVTMNVYQHLTQKMSDKGSEILDKLF